MLTINIVKKFFQNIIQKEISVLWSHLEEGIPIVDNIIATVHHQKHTKRSYLMCFFAQNSV